jgi:cytoskeleton protein RodZ
VTAPAAPAAGNEPNQPPASPAGEAAPPAADAPATHERAEARAGERQVHMVFEQDAWVEIRDRSGKAIFSRLNPRGTRQTVSGQPPLAVIVGNSQGVRLTYDDQPVDLAQYTKVDVARFNLE